MTCAPTNASLMDLVKDSPRRPDALKLKNTGRAIECQAIGFTAGIAEDTDAIRRSMRFLKRQAAQSFFAAQDFEDIVTELESKRARGGDVDALEDSDSEDEVTRHMRLATLYPM